jgi:hypothetical protein
MAALKLIYDKKEDIPAAFLELYEEGDDEKWTLTGIEGIKTQADIDKVSTALRKERAEHKATKDKIKGLGNRTIEEVIEQLDRIPELEATIAASDMDPKKIDALVEARIKGRLAPVERERDTLKTKVGELEGEVTTYKGDRKTRTIHDSIREAATKAKLLPEALDDALMLGERVFDVGEDGKVTIKDNVGFTPGVDPTVWFTDMQKKRPHWWGPSSGGGAGGNRGGGNGITTNPWASDTWNMTEQGRIYVENPERATQLATQAGTKIGGMRPQPKK